jgi:BMFP domain-containing protein YqiC
VEIENTTVLASAREDAEGLAQKITLLEDELAVECRAQEVWKREH